VENRFSHRAFLSLLCGSAFFLRLRKAQALLRIGPPKVYRVAFDTAEFFADSSEQTIPRRLTFARCCPRTLRWSSFCLIQSDSSSNIGTLPGYGSAFRLPRPSVEVGSGSLRIPRRRRTIFIGCGNHNGFSFLCLRLGGTFSPASSPSFACGRRCERTKSAFPDCLLNRKLRPCNFARLRILTV
jgi:hypothetical protein